MKYCSHCGNELLDDAVICPKCGCSVNYGGNSQAQNQQASVPYEMDAYSGLSIIGFIFAIFSSLIGLIISIIAHNEAKTTGSQKSLSLSKAGIIISSIMMGLGILASIICLIIIFVAIGLGVGYYGVI